MLRELKTFIAVVELKSFTQAGQLVGLSQPAVSAHIKMLEQQFEIQLLRRANKQLIVTEGGQILYQHAKEIVELVQLTHEDLKNCAEEAGGILKIGASYTIGEYILPDVLVEFNHIYPNIEVELIIGDTADISKKVCDLTVDLGFIEGLVRYNGLEQTYFKEDLMALLVPADHPFANRKVSDEELDNQKWIVREVGSGTRENWDLYLSSHQMKYRSLLVLGSNVSLKRAVQAGLGIGFASIELLAGETAIAPAYLQETSARQLSYIRIRNIHLPRTARLFLEVFHKSFPVEKPMF